MTVLVARTAVGLLVTAYLFVSASVNLLYDPIDKVKYDNKSITYSLTAKQEGKKIPIKVEYRNKRIKINYKKNGNNVEIDYEREGNVGLNLKEQELMDFATKVVERHSRGWLANTGGRLHGLITDMRNTLMRKR